MNPYVDITDFVIGRFVDSRTKPALRAQEISPQRQAYRMAAAVLHCFEPSHLAPLHMDENSNARTEFFSTDVVKAAGASGSGWYTLDANVRRDTLALFDDRKDLLDALRANPARLETPLQNTFEGWLSGKFSKEALDKLSLEQLRETKQISTWFSNSSLLALPDESVLARQLEWARLFSEFEHLAGRKFFGRETELELLGDYVGVAPTRKWTKRIKRSLQHTREQISGASPPALVIYGPGGIGKSSLIGRFLHEHVGYAHAQRFPFIYIGFDNTSLRIHDPVTILVEAMAQLERQFGRDNKLLVEFGEVLKQTRDSRAYEAERSGRATVSAALSSRLRAADESMFVAFASLLLGLVEDSWPKSTESSSGSFGRSWEFWSSEPYRPVVLFFDAFEEVQFRDPAFLSRFADLLSILQELVPHLRIIISGRATVTNVQVRGVPLRNYQLGDLDIKASSQLIRSMTRLPTPVCNELAEQFGGMPLTLKLLSRLLAKEADELGQAELIDSIQRDGARMYMMSSDVVIGYLYHRVLDHIHDDDVKSLAHPGMVLRYVAPPMIRGILAEPCKVEVASAERVTELYDALKAEHALVSVRDEQTLIFRPEVRKPMLRLLLQDRPEQVKALHRAAASFFEQNDDPASRAELLYHLMMLGEDTSVLEEYWQPGLGFALQDTLDELPLPAAAWLAAHLGVAMNDDMIGAAERADLERAAGKQALYSMREHQLDLTIVTLNECYPFLPGSALYGILARLLAETEEYEEALQVVSTGIRLMDQNPNVGRLVELRMIEAVCEGRLGCVEDAERALTQAECHAWTVADRMCLTHVLTVRALNDMARHTQRSPWDFAKPRLIMNLAECLRELDSARIDSYPALLAWSAALVAKAFPDISSAVFDIIGEDTLRRVTSERGALTLIGLDTPTSNYDDAIHDSFQVDHAHRLNDDNAIASRIAAVVLQSQPMWAPQDVPGLDQYRDEWEKQATQAVMA